MIYANCGAIAAIASMTYMTIVELFGEYPAPFSPEMMIYMMIYIEWHNIMNENRKKHQSLLLREIGSDLGLSSPPSCLLFDMVIKKPNTCTPGLKLAYHYHFHAYRPQLLCSKVFL